MRCYRNMLHLLSYLGLACFSSGCNSGAGEVAKSPQPEVSYTLSSAKLTTFLGEKPQEISLMFASQSAGVSDLQLDLTNLPPQIQLVDPLTKPSCRRLAAGGCQFKLRLTSSHLINGEVKLGYSYRRPDLSLQQGTVKLPYQVSGWIKLTQVRYCVDPNCYMVQISSLAVDSFGGLYIADNNGFVHYYGSHYHYLLDLAFSDGGPFVFPNFPTGFATTSIAIDSLQNLYVTSYSSIGGILWSIPVGNNSATSGKQVYTWNWYHPWMAATSPNQQYVYASDGDGDIISNWGSGSSFSQVATTPSTDDARALIMDSAWGLYVAQSSTLYYTAAGSNWSWLNVDNGGLINALAADNSGRVYGGWQSGAVIVYQNGSSFGRVGSVLPQAVTSLAWNSVVDTVFAGTGLYTYSSALSNGNIMPYSQGNDVWYFNGRSWVSTGLGALDSYDVNVLFSSGNQLYAGLSDGSIYELSL